MRRPAAQDQPVKPDAAKIEAFLKLCETSRRGAILQLEHTLRGLRAQGDRTPEMARQIARIEANLRVLQANKEPVVPTLVYPPSAGAIGRLPRLTCHVNQVVSEREMLVHCKFPVRVTTMRHFQAESETISQEVKFLIRGASTRELQEGTDVELTQVFEVTGKETYKTVSGGSKTIWALAEFDMAAVEPYFRRAAAKSP